MKNRDEIKAEIKKRETIKPRTFQELRRNSTIINTLKWVIEEASYLNINNGQKKLY